jgi:predicted dehydrogenase
MKTDNKEKSIDRRTFLGSTAAAVAAFTIVPRHVLGGPGYTPPSEKLNIASVGAGGQAGGDIGRVDSENIVALCDVDEKCAAKTFEKYPNAQKFKDFRIMLEKMDKQIDAVIVATPDHTHAVAAMMAMKMGKHVYVEKPLTHSIYEARMLAEAAKKYKVATQMGNQGHSGEGNRLICEWIADGAIGKVREVHVWTDRPGGRWAQGVDRPKETPEVPQTLDWDLWLGPAPERPYHSDYLPFKWRGWWDFGTGALGDMGCHIIDTPFWALKLGHPISIEAISTEVNSETAPVASKIDYQFPSRGDMPPVKMSWYDGGLKPTLPDDLEPGRRIGDKNGGVLLIGENGSIMCGCYGGGARIIPEEKMKAYKQPPKIIPRSKGHHKDWIEACKGAGPASSNFDHAGPLTETVLLGNLAIRTGRKLLWDGPNMKVTNYPEANQYVRREYRQGWTL